MSPNTFKSTLESLKTNKRIITPNRRLASFLNKQLTGILRDDEILDIHILAWQDALLHFRLQYPLIFQQGLLSAWQSRFLWQGVICASSAAEGLMNITDTQTRVATAADLCVDWCMETSSFAGQKEESDLFIAWYAAYQARCKILQVQDQALLSADLLQAVQAGALKNESLLFYGFDEFTPLQSALIDALRAKGSQIILVDGHEFHSTVALCTADDRRDEWMTAILDARACWIAAGINAPHPVLPIGIVIPDIAEHWHELSQLLMDVFDPDHTSTSAQDLPFNISSGMALYDHPAVYAAMTILSLVRSSEVSAYTLTYLCTTPYIHGTQDATEASERARFDVQCRETQAMTHDKQRLSAQADIPASLRECLSLTISEGPVKRSCSAWVDEIMQILSKAGWPGERALASTTYQAVEQFYETLTMLRTLDAVCEGLDNDALINQLSSQLKKTLFQPQTEDKPIQILGLLEAAGLSFSHLWVCGMDDTLPESPKPNPFIPTQVQRAANMPHASAEREWSFMQKMVNRLSCSSAEVVFSYSQHSEEGFERHASPCVKHFPSVSISEKRLSHETLAQRMQAQADLEIMPDEAGIPYTGDTLRGGAGLLQAQIACPFRAYALYRWKAKDLETPTYGLSLKARGLWVHAIMQKLMTLFPDVVALQAVDDVILNDAVALCVQEVLLAAQPPLLHALRTVEAQRLSEIIGTYMKAERERGDFRVKALECPVTVNLAGKNLVLRIDRWDETAYGSVLIDYKTGSASVKNWGGDELDDPQLPLYALSMETPPAGLAYVVLRTNEVHTEGLGTATMSGLETLTEEVWLEKQEGWRQVLTDKAEAFLKGEAGLTPKYGEYTCQDCTLKSCCRIAEIEVEYE